MLDTAANLKDKEALLQKKQKEQEQLQQEITQLKAKNDAQAKGLAEDVKNIKDKEVDQEELKKLLADHRAKKAKMIEDEAKLHFSYELQQSQTEDEKLANEKLQKLKGDLLTPMYNVVLHNFFKNKEQVEASKLFKVLDAMPKGGLHHIHTTAAPHVDTYISLTYYKETHYNEREGLFKVFPDMRHEDGYVSCEEMRNFKVDKDEYDESLRQQILQTSEECTGFESHEIWQYFQHKFARIGGLGKYKPFFKILLKSNIEACIAQNVFIVELRHTTGCLFDENKKPVPLLDEIAIIQEIIDETRKKVPYFRMSLILTSYKIVGHSHVNKILDHIRIAKEKHPDLIAGFDMVNEEEYTPGIQEFMPQILGAQQDKGVTNNMACFFHAGETHQKDITNLHDSVLLNTKRIGHGFQLFLFPNLVKEVIKRDICVECCPLSNMVLGYTLDLRNHPIRYLMHHGLQVSISSDDPGFFHYQGVTLDYVYVAIAWELDLMDLKKLSLNGIQYSSVPDAVKKDLLDNVFPKKWAEFVAMLKDFEV